MKVVGFNFDKINIERKSDIVNDIKVNTNIEITDVQSIKNEVLKTKEELISIKFQFSVNYDPGFAKIDLSGNVLFSVDSKDAKEILKKWEDKKFPEAARIEFFNVILRKSNIKALELEEEMNIPLHMPLFSLKKPTNE